MILWYDTEIGKNRRLDEEESVQKDLLTIAEVISPFSERNKPSLVADLNCREAKLLNTR